MRAFDLSPQRQKPSLWNRISSSPTSLFQLSFAGVYLLLILVLRSIAQRDPGSWFFNPRSAYRPQYSKVRTQEANAYIAKLSAHAAEKSTHLPGAFVSSADRQLCVGIASVAREGAQYLGTTVGSLLQGLADDDREDMHIKVLIAHTNPLKHPDYLESWLSAGVDDVLLYRNLSESQLQLVEEGERNRAQLEKWVFDYTYLAKGCLATGAEYVAMLEGDVLAAEGWYTRTMEGLIEAEAQSRGVSPEGCKLT